MEMEMRMRQAIPWLICLLVSFLLLPPEILAGWPDTELNRDDARLVEVTWRVADRIAGEMGKGGDDYYLWRRNVAVIMAIGLKEHLSITLSDTLEKFARDFEALPPSSDDILKAPPFRYFTVRRWAQKLKKALDKPYTNEDVINRIDWLEKKVMDPVTSSSSGGEFMVYGSLFKPEVRFGATSDLDWSYATDHPAEREAYLETAQKVRANLLASDGIELIVHEPLRLWQQGEAMLRTDLHGRRKVVMRGVGPTLSKELGHPLREEFIERLKHPDNPVPIPDGIMDSLIRMVEARKATSTSTESEASSLRPGSGVDLGEFAKWTSPAKKLSDISGDVTRIGLPVGRPRGEQSDFDDNWVDRFLKEEFSPRTDVVVDEDPFKGKTLYLVSDLHMGDGTQKDNFLPFRKKFERFFKETIEGGQKKLALEISKIDPAARDRVRAGSDGESRPVKDWLRNPVRKIGAKLSSKRGLGTSILDRLNGVLGRTTAAERSQVKRVGK